MDWLWIVGYFIIGIITGVLFRVSVGGRDGDVSELVALGGLVLLWPMLIPILVIVGIGKIVSLLVTVFGGDRQ